MGRESLDVEKTAIELVMNDNVAKERQLASAHRGPTTKRKC